MGVFINLSISHSVTKDEWASVYRETLRLVETLPFAERREVPVRGIMTRCLVPTKEREQRYAWNKDKLCTGWSADGDYESLCTAERFFVPRDLVTDNGYDPHAPDAMFSILPNYLRYNHNDPRFFRCYDLWDAKTQGEPYHMYLLAVGCLIESRLGSKAFLHGDITKRQCRKAVEIANEHLDNKIDIPACCDPERLLERIRTFPLSESEIMNVYTSFYLGKRDAAFGDDLRKQFSEKAADLYWRERIGNHPVKKNGFTSAIYEYLLWGFSLKSLAGYLSFDEEEGNMYYEEYVRQIMETKLYLKDKGRHDLPRADIEDEHPFEIDAMFVQVILGGAANKIIDRYIPLDDIRRDLISSIGDKCDVNQVIDNYLKEDADHQNAQNAEAGIPLKERGEKGISHEVSAGLTQNKEVVRKEIKANYDQYDIAEYEALPYYEFGDSINPVIAKQVGRYFSFYRSKIKESKFAELMGKSPEERCGWLIFQNRSVLLRDIDWEKIFADIMKNPESFERYYPMVRVKITDEGVRYLLQAIAVNDGFYRELSRLEEDAANDSTDR